MFSLVKFTNDEYWVAPSNRVQIIQDRICLVKYKSGTKYHATLIQTSDSDEQLKNLQELQCKLQVEGNADESVKCGLQSKSLQNSTENHSYEIHGNGCSTPVDGALLSSLPEHLSLSEIIDERKSSTSFGNCTYQSAESSAPPSCSEIIKNVGDDWMKEFGVTHERFDVEKSDVDQEEENNQRNKNEIRSVEEGIADVQEKENNERNENEVRGLEERRADVQEKEDNQRDENEVRGVEETRADEQEKKDNERNENEVRGVEETRADVEEKEDNERNNNEVQGVNGGRADVEEEEDNERNKNKVRVVEEGRADVQEKENNERNENEVRGLEEKRADVQEKDDNQRNENEVRGVEETRADEQEKEDNERNENEVRGVEEGRADIQEGVDNDRNNNEVRDIDEGRADVEEEEDNERNENEVRGVEEGRADIQEGVDNERNNNEVRDIDKGRADVEEEEDNERNENEVRGVEEGRADMQEGVDNERNNNEVRDIDEGRAGESCTEDDDQDVAKDSDYSDANCTDDDDDVAKDSNYLPDKSTLNKTFQISQVNLTKNLSKSNIDALPVDIRLLNVPVSKNPATTNVKKYFCPYCQKLQTKFARHLESQHKSEADVGRFTKLPKGNHERSKIIEAIRKHGNFLHNTDSDLNTGILITCRRRQQKYDRSVEDYVCCSTCKGFFSKQTLRLHIVKCNTARKKGVRDMTVMGRRLTGYIHELANPVLRRTVFPVMRDDEVVRSIKYDELLILFGNRLCDKYTHTHQHDMIRAQLRLLGRFKCAIKDIKTEIDDFASILHPKFYDAAILAVRECAKYDSVTQTFQTPAVATMLGTLIKKCITRRKAQCIRKQDYEGKKAAEEFLVLFEDDFPTTINKKVMEDQTKQKRQKKIILPSGQDIRKLYDFLKKKCRTSLATLEQQFDLSAWKLLTECTLILVQIFNRRRAGEIERLLVTDYENQTELDENVNADIYAKLSNESREYAKQFVRLTIRGKLGRTVPVLLYPLHVACINMISKYRTEAGVASSNEYIFSVPNSGRLKKKYLRACTLMRKFAQECGAVMPTSLRGTTLRKHIATFFAMEGIGENDVTDLANFMGHDKAIHKDVYRVPIPIREVTHVSKLLQAAMGQSEDEESSDEEASEPDDHLNDSTDNINSGNSESECESSTAVDNIRSTSKRQSRSSVNNKNTRNSESEESCAAANNIEKTLKRRKRSSVNNKNTRNSENEESCAAANNIGKTLKRRNRISVNNIDASDGEKSSAEASNIADKSSSKRRSTSPYGKTKRTRWTNDEKAAVKCFFGDPVKIKQLPSLKDCQDSIKKCKALRNRKPQVIKTWIDNQRRF